MFKVHIKDRSHSIIPGQNNVIVDGELWNWDLIKISENLYHLIKDSRSYVVELISVDPDKKRVHLKVNGEFFEADVQDRYDILLEKLGMNQSGNSSHLEVKAPMPGKILEVLVSQGQKVKKGDQLLVLEAMKMENMIKSAGDGVVTAIFVKKGMNVEKNQVMIQF